jgi:hypothetical protein
MSEIAVKKPVYFFNPKRFKSYFLMDTDKYFSGGAKTVLDGDDCDKRRIFIDNGAKVLFVAHLDTVQEPFFHGYNKKKQILICDGLDDRLGFYVACTLVNTYKLKADILLCDNEEKGATTAQYHTCKEYNWIVEFDRTGYDVVTYNRDCPDLIKALTSYWKKGWGSFSDICAIGTKSACFNLGIGYTTAHAKKDIVNIKLHNEQINDFITFYYRFYNTAFKIENESGKLASWQKPKYTYYGGYGYGASRGRWVGGKWTYPADDYDDYYGDDYSHWNFDRADDDKAILDAKGKKVLRCDFCNIDSTAGALVAKVFGCNICSDCFDFATEALIDTEGL